MQFEDEKEFSKGEKETDSLAFEAENTSENKRPDQLSVRELK
jgi:hypothetical protein